MIVIHYPNSGAYFMSVTALIFLHNQTFFPFRCDQSLMLWTPGLCKIIAWFRAVVLHSGEFVNSEQEHI